jgi:hypothetical protein
MLLPAAERQGEIHFYIAKSLPYFVRLPVAFLLLACGLAMQLAAPQLFDGAQVIGIGAGIILVLAGVLMLLTKGFDNKTKVQTATLNWRPAGRAEVERILAINEKQKAWDQDFVDITCGRGKLGVLVIALGVLAAAGAAWLYLPHSAHPMLKLLAINAAVMVLPFWITGTRSFLKHDQLIIKVKMLLELEQLFNRIRREDEEFQYQLQSAKARDGSGEVPCDVKGVIHFHDGPPEFLGVQMQISINSVQGADYPYFYCVLVSKSAFGDLEVQRPPAPERKGCITVTKGGAVPTTADGIPELVVSQEHEEEVNIVVIRQKTTKQSGYHTNQKAANGIFRYVLDQARHVLAEQP